MSAVSPQVSYLISVEGNDHVVHLQRNEWVVICLSAHSHSHSHTHTHSLTHSLTHTHTLSHSEWGSCNCFSESQQRLFTSSSSASLVTPDVKISASGKQLIVVTVVTDGVRSDEQMLNQQVMFPHVVMCEQRQQRVLSCLISQPLK